MNRIKIMKELRALMASMMEVEIPAELKETDRIYEDLGIDSIMVMQLMVGLEEKFNITVPEEEVDPDNFSTVGNFVSFIQGLQNK
jgi:aryl carrier protein AsbD